MKIKIVNYATMKTMGIKMKMRIDFLMDMIFIQMIKDRFKM